MSRIVLDASAILAVIHQESGYEKLTPELLAEAVANTVNLAEVQSKLVSRGWTSDEAWEDATSPTQEALPFSEEHARIAGDLVATTRSRGLSLGDRACLALGIALKAPVYTAEKRGRTLGWSSAFTSYADPGCQPASHYSQRRLAEEPFAVILVRVCAAQVFARIALDQDADFCGALGCGSGRDEPAFQVLHQFARVEPSGSSPAAVSSPPGGRTICRDLDKGVCRSGLRAHRARSGRGLPRRARARSEW